MTAAAAARVRVFIVSCVVFASVVLVACTDMLVGKLPESTPETLYDQIWRDFDRYYASFQIRHIDWDSVDRHNRPLAHAAKTDADLLDVLRPMISQMRDPHIDLQVSPLTVYVSVNPGAITTFFDPAIIQQRYSLVPTTSKSGKLLYGQLGTDVCYISIRSFDGTGWSSELDGVLAQTCSGRSVIVDVRDNLGGISNVAEELAGRFVTKSRVFAYVRYRSGPARTDFTDYRSVEVVPVGAQRYSGALVVLTNRKTISAAEHFVLALRERNSTTIIGDTTAGGMSSPLVRELPNGWLFRVPHWIEYDVDRKTYEGVGIPPTIAVSYSASQANALFDPQLEAALARLRQ